MNGQLTENDKKELTTLLKGLVAIPSVNNGADQPGVPEQAMAEYLADYLSDLKMKVEWLIMPNGRPNLLARWPELSGKKVLALTAHMDTVNIDAMTVEPFSGEIRDGKIYGRGACDTKGSLAAYLWTLKTLAGRREHLAYDLQFLATCDEENGCVGSTWLAENKKVAADCMIVGEPTDSRVAVAHRGSIVLQIHTAGVSAHASIPHRGDNAIYQMNEILTVLRNEWIPAVEAQTHSFLGKANASITKIHGGNRYNIVPEACTITIDMRVLPDHHPREILKHLETLLSPLRKSAKVNYNIECICHQPALFTDPNLPFVKQLLIASQTVTGHGEPISVAYFADSSPFSNLGCQCVLLGPGNIATAHSADEYLELEQLFQTTKILANFLAR